MEEQNISFLSSRRVAQLAESLDLIIDAGSSTKSIREGERLLSDLRQAGEFPELLANYLSVEKQEKKNLLVLLELRKQNSLSRSSVWWHLVRYYYLCNQKAANIIVDIVVAPSNLILLSFQEFLLHATTTQEWGFAHAHRLLHLLSRTVEEMESKKEASNWYMEHAQKLKEGLLFLLKHNKHGDIYQDRMIILLLRLGLFLGKQVEIEALHQSLVSNFLLGLGKEGMESSMVSEVIGLILNKEKKYPHLLEVMKLSCQYYEKSFKHHWRVILAQYWEYVSNQPLHNQSSQRTLIFHHTITEEFTLLNHLVGEHLPELGALATSQTHMFILIAATNNVIPNIEPTLLEILESSDSRTILYALRYIMYAHDSIYPHYYAQLARAVLDLRGREGQLRGLCDQVEEVLVEAVLACVEVPYLWSFAQEYIHHLLGSLMDLSCASFLPVLLLLHHCVEYWLGDRNFCTEVFPTFCATLMELLGEEATDETHEIAYKLIEVFNRFYQVYGVEDGLLTTLIKYIDRYQLYCSYDASQLYTIYLINLASSYYSETFLSNLQDEHFWLALPLSDISFYVGVFMGITEKCNTNIQGKIHHLTEILIHIVHRVNSCEENSQERLEELKNKLSCYQQYLAPVIVQIDKFL